jgi:hypothetical protein
MLRLIRGYLIFGRWFGSFDGVNDRPSRKRVAPLIGLVLVLQVFACQDLLGTNDQSVDPAQSVQSPLPDQGQESGQEAGQEPNQEGIDSSDDTLIGACSKMDRDDYIHKDDQEFIHQVQSCGSRSPGNRERFAACLTKNLPSLSDGCVDCFADMSRCAFEHCKTACVISTASDGCKECASHHCEESLVSCSGVAGADLP